MTSDIAFIEKTVRTFKGEVMQVSCIDNQIEVRLNSGVYVFDSLEECIAAIRACFADCHLRSVKKAS